ncbi:hypothetical protein CCICO_10695 [Corynebacterium ciconiae DSM 44920]|nr:hypothetical protein CCICO_10695 [Corynebacterium ciconiae DSM 44920]
MGRKKAVSPPQPTCSPYAECMLSFSSVCKTSVSAGVGLVVLTGCASLPFISQGSDESSSESAAAVATVTETATETVTRSSASTTTTAQSSADQWESGDSVDEIAGGICDPERIRTDIDWGSLFTVNFCDGSFARVGTPNTGSVQYVRWNGDSWEVIESDGRTNTGFPCYDRAHLVELGCRQAISRVCCSAMSPPSEGLIGRSRDEGLESTTKTGALNIEK